MKTEAIVNAANTNLEMGWGVCGAIFNVAGAKELQEACDKIGKCPVGKAVITDGFKLSKYIIHTVGPIWKGGGNNEENYLYSAYMSSLKLALKHSVVLIIW